MRSGGFGSFSASHKNTPLHAIHVQGCVFLSQFLRSSALVVLAVFFLVGGLTGQIHSQPIEGIHVHAGQDDGGVDVAALELGELMEGQRGGLVLSSRAGQRDQNFIGVQAGVPAAQIVRLQGLDGLNGTGGDEVGSFNISTTAAFVAAAGGVPVAKHGNRSVSSKSGAADVLEELGVVLSLTPEQNEKVLADTGICFLFAQGYHKSMKNVAPVRKGMGERTIFNVLGPLSNPARATMQLLGVYDENLVMPMAQVLANLGVTRGMVVCGGGMDEASLIGENKVCEIRDGELTPYQLDPEKYGLSLCTVDDLRGGSPKVNAQITRDILSGREQGAKREEILLNAGIALYLGLDGLTLEDGIKKAAELIDSGAALAKLDQFAAATQEAAKA